MQEISFGTSCLCFAIMVQNGSDGAAILTVPPLSTVLVIRRIDSSSPLTAQLFLTLLAISLQTPTKRHTLLLCSGDGRQGSCLLLPNTCGCDREAGWLGNYIFPSTSGIVEHGLAKLQLRHSPHCCTALHLFCVRKPHKLCVYVCVFITHLFKLHKRLRVWGLYFQIPIRLSGNEVPQCSIFCKET